MVFRLTKVSRLSQLSKVSSLFNFKDKRMALKRSSALEGILWRSFDSPLDVATAWAQNHPQNGCLNFLPFYRRVLIILSCLEDGN